MKTSISGYLVTEGPEAISNICYSGVDTNAWPIGLTHLSELAPEMYEKTYIDSSYPLLIDLPSAIQYCSLCINDGKSPRILYCEVIDKNSTIGIPDHRVSSCYTLLGYDYAYPNGDYYSAVANDIIYSKGYLRHKWRKYLNEHGLFSSKDQIQLFVQERTALSNKLANTLTIELGNFVIFRVFCVRNYGGSV